MNRAYVRKMGKIRRLFGNRAFRVALGFRQDMKTASELDEIVLGAQRGESDAFDLLVEQFGPRLFGFAYRLTARKQDAEDIVQDVFLKVVRTIDRYEHDSRFEAWLFRIASNTIKDRIRGAVRGGSVGSLDVLASGSGGDEAGFDERAPSTPRSVVDQMMTAEEVERIQVHLSRLPLAEREVVMLRHYSDMSFAEIAEMMGTPLGTALARAHRGLAKLREWMEAGS